MERTAICRTFVVFTDFNDSFFDFSFYCFLLKLRRSVQVCVLFCLYLISHMGCIFIIPMIWFLFGSFFFSSLLDIKFNRIIVFSFLLLWIVSCMCLRMNVLLPHIVKIISILSGMIFFIGCIRLNLIKMPNVEFLKQNFFYYCSHMIFISWGTYSLLLLNRSSLLYGTIVTVFVVCMGILGPIVLYKVINRWAPKMAVILTGGRI